MIFFCIVFEILGDPQSLVMVEEEDPSPVEVNGDEDEDAKGKRKCISDAWDHFKRKKVNEKFNLNGITVTSISCAILNRAQAICAVI